MPWNRTSSYGGLAVSRSSARNAWMMAADPVAGSILMMLKMSILLNRDRSSTRP
jgi:hypothetical protein